MGELHGEQRITADSSTHRQEYQPYQNMLAKTMLSVSSRSPSKILCVRTFNSSRRRPPHPAVPRYVFAIAGGVAATAGITYYSCLDYVPYTNRRRWVVTSPEFERQLGDQEYLNLLKQFRGKILPEHHRASQTLNRVGQRIVEASKEFAQKHSMKLINQPYTFTVIRSDMANAFVLPGNHVFLFTGLFEYIHDEDELAVVIGHELSHNLARHAGEKISGSAVVQLLARLVFLLDPTGVLAVLMLPAASLFRELPNSRIQEMEADEIGLQLVTMACYDPRAAKRVFGSMQADGPPEFLSTHPSHSTRIKKFDTLVPKALSQQDGEKCHLIRQQMRQARQAAALQASMRERRV